MTTPPEWKERFDKQFSYTDEQGNRYSLEDIKFFISQELLSIEIRVRKECAEELEEAMNRLDFSKLPKTNCGLLIMKWRQSSKELERREKESK